MNAPLTQAASRTLAVLLLAAVVAVAYFGTLAPALDAYEDYTSSIDELEFRIARYKQALKEKPALEKRLAKAVSDRSLKEYLLSGASTQLAAASLQERLKKTIFKNGGQFISVQTMAGQTVGELEEVTIGVILEGDIGALKAILYAIESDRIVLLIDKIRIRTRLSRSDGKLGEKKAVMLKVALRVNGYRQRE